MSRPASDKTIIARLRRENSRLSKDLSLAHQTATGYRIRATKAEQELAEWKTRFDRLLEFRKLGVIEGGNTATGDRHD